MQSEQKAGGQALGAGDLGYYVWSPGSATEVPTAGEEMKLTCDHAAPFSPKFAPFTGLLL